MTRGTRFPRRPIASALAAAFLIGTLAPVGAQTSRYENKLLELSEILGSMHYLQQICETYDTQTWRSQMISLMRAEGASGDRKSRMTDAFNRGYSRQQDWFSSCTDGASVKVDQFTREGSALTTWLSNNRE